jgi:DNA-binding protein H-NS
MTELKLMKRAELDRMSTDDLWSLHVEVSQLLQQRIHQEKLQLEERLRMLQTPVVSGRRPYPPVLPKYCNPDQPSETWSGRGKRPRWLVKHLKSGRRVEDFRIQVPNKGKISGRHAASSRQRA